MSDPLSNGIASLRIVIVGAGQAAAQAVETLRKRGHTGPITVIGDETSLPYQRPPLSKKYLAGTLDRDRLLFRHAAHYTEHNVTLRLGFPAVRIDRQRRRVEIADGSSVEYDGLLLATGSHPRPLPLPGAELAGVHYLRTVADVDRLRAELAPDRRAVIVGGGYIGLEVAATCREAGLAVVVLEAADRVMKRVVAPEVSRFYESEHARHGVKILCNARISALVPVGSVPGRDSRDSRDSRESGESRESRPGTASCGTTGSGTQRVGAVRMRDGSEVPADFVLVAIGVAPTDALAREAGLDCADGIVVNEYCQTSDTRIWAAGDCTQHPSLHFGRDVRLESVDHAFEQGVTAALNMLGIRTAHDKVPWFWSDQFDLKMVIVGLAGGHDAMVLRGDPVSRAFSVCYLKAGELIAVETVNHIRDQMAARKLIPLRARPDPARLADDSIPLKDTV